MAKAAGSITVEMRAVCVYLIFFPIATYKKIGDVEILRVLGVPVYKRIGDVESICGVVRHRGAPRAA